jgi:hypothetical protein
MNFIMVGSFQRAIAVAAVSTSPQRVQIDLGIAKRIYERGSSTPISG